MCGKDKGYYGCVFWRGGVYGYNESGSSFVEDTGTIANVNGSASNAGFDTLNSAYYKSTEDFTRVRENAANLVSQTTTKIH